MLVRRKRKEKGSVVFVGDGLRTSRRIASAMRVVEDADPYRIIPYVEKTDALSDVRVLVYQPILLSFRVMALFL